MLQEHKPRDDKNRSEVYVTASVLESVVSLLTRKALEVGDFGGNCDYTNNAIMKGRTKLTKMRCERLEGFDELQER